AGAPLGHRSTTAKRSWTGCLTATLSRLLQGRPPAGRDVEGNRLLELIMHAAVPCDGAGPALHAGDGGPMRLSLHSFSAVAAALIAVALSGFVHASVTHHYFWGDDFYHLYRMRNLPLWAFLLQPQGGHLQATSFGIFYLVARFAGARSELYFEWVLATHLLNVALLFVAIRRVAGAAWLAGVGPVLWGASPVVAGALGWLAVYGHVLLATWVLCLLLELLVIEERRQVSPWAAARWVMLLVLGATSFGIGIGI